MLFNKTFQSIMQGTNKYFNIIGRMQTIVKSYGRFTSDWPRLSTAWFDVLSFTGLQSLLPGSLALREAVNAVMMFKR